MTASAASPPRRWGRTSAALARWALARAGWRIAGPFPDVPKAVIVVAPHTSNWDFPVGAATMVALRLRIGWLAKHTLFWWPLGWILLWLGGIPVRRDSGARTVAQVVERFRRSRRLLIAITPEGTRRAVERWRMGFAHIARDAQAPIVPVALDWGRRVVRIGDPIPAQGDLERLADELKAWFSEARGRRS